MSIKIPMLWKLKSAKEMKKQLETIINDLEIIKEAINNGDSKDAVQMLSDLKEDLMLIVLMA